MKIAWMAALALFLLPVAGWSVEKKEQHVSLDQLPAPVKASIEKESAGGKVGEIEKETEHGRTFYEVEIVRDGTESYVHVAQDGKVLKRESAAEERKAEGAEKEHRH